MRNFHNIYNNFKWIQCSDKKSYLEVYFKAMKMDHCKEKAIYVTWEIG